MKTILIMVFVCAILFFGFALSYEGEIGERISNAAYDLTFFFRFINNHSAFIVWMQFLFFGIAIKSGFIRIGKTGI